MSHMGLFIVSTLLAMALHSHAKRVKVQEHALQDDVVETQTQMLEQHAVPGGQCTEAEFAVFQDHFQVGEKYDKACRHEEKWGKDVLYNHPKKPRTVSLFFYPDSDIDGAFSMCDEKRKFDRSLCKALEAQTIDNHVQLHRVGSVGEATKIIGHVPYDAWITHVVFAGSLSGNRNSWGLQAGDPITDIFLGSMEPFFVKGLAATTVVLDGGDSMGDSMAPGSLLKSITDRLAGARVFGSHKSWRNRPSQAALKEAQATQTAGGLDDWGFQPGNFCEDKGEAEAAEDISECRVACESNDSCVAFSWYPEGNKKLSNKCYLSSGCESTSASSKGAITFRRPAA